jgi:septum formation protein
VSEEGILGDPEHGACLLAEKKACAVYPRALGYWVVGADTIVVMDDMAPHMPGSHPDGSAIVLGKPENAAEAGNMLRLISGKEHRVITGFCILDPSGQIIHSEPISTRVVIKELTDKEIQAYINTEEPFDKAGAYAIQGIGSFMVKGISGSYTNVVGLPLYALIKSLISVGALKSFPLPPD